ncbi:hypothetical protein P7K49_038606 [Saguinus oedipus]|uniref:Uncharacterized protein n=1 Tax=Saguinus oedipus TaxID=9490 RepID=A0ABQ9TFJ3_SAGOE|nr:hypothetical protein P7K49_038606 [Saguinus oedipus]
MVADCRAFPISLPHPFSQFLKEQACNLGRREKWRKTKSACGVRACLALRECPLSEAVVLGRPALYVAGHL